MIYPLLPFSPMEPVPYCKPFDDNNTGFQIKWDGVRILAHLKCGKVELFNKRKNRRTVQYPEIVYALSEMFKHDVILDGEIIALKSGKPSFSALIKRDFAKTQSTINYLYSKIPVTYVVFDIIYYKGKDLTSLPFRSRDELVKSLITSSDPIVVTDTVIGNGNALFSVVKNANLEGIVAKKLKSTYKIANKSRDWLKIKNRRKLTAYIGGYISEGNQIKSLLLGLFQDGDFIYAGRAASGLSSSTSVSLFERLQMIQSLSCPFSNKPNLCKRKNVQWVTPVIRVSVEYAEFTDDGLIRQPVIKEIYYD